MMDKMIIHGGTPLRGEVDLSGSKNAALPILMAAALTDEPVVLHNLPKVRDVRTSLELLARLGVKSRWLDEHAVEIHAATIDSHEAPYELVKTMRASFLVLGPLLARTGRARVSTPGGCAIGARPVNLHIAGLRALGFEAQAARSVHFSYEVVALSPRCAAEMGYEITEEESKSYVEVSGRKGHGVKADDLITRMLQAAESRVRQKQATMESQELAKTANALAVGALRFFLLKYTRSTIIAFDFEDALKAEGETGPYCQYAVVRIRGIRRKGTESLADRQAITSDSLKKFLEGPEGADLWELVLLIGSLDYSVDAAIIAQEPAFVAKYAFQLAQSFNNFYHKHHILSEPDEQKLAFLLGLTELVERRLVQALSLLGIETPEKM